MSDPVVATDATISPFEGILPGRPAPFFLEKGEGEKSVVFDTLFTIMLTGDETENHFGVFTCEGPKGDRIPPHIHPVTHEIFYIADGAVTLWIDDQKGFADKRTLREGDFGFVPRGAVHAFRMDAASKIFGVGSGGFERFFHEMGTPTEQTGIPQVPYIPQFPQMKAAGDKYGTVFMPDFQLPD